MEKFLWSIVLAMIILFAFNSSANAQTINEFVGNASPEWVEFYNASDSADFLKSYWIDDDADFISDSGSSQKKQLTSLNTSNINYPYFELPIISHIFNNTGGDFVVLFDSLGNKIDEYHYENNLAENISIGRSPDGNGAFYILTAATKGNLNTGPVVTATPTSNPTNTPTATPTSAPLKTATPTPVPLKTKTPTPKPTSKSSSSPSSSSEILGETNISVSTASSESISGSDTSLPIVPIVLVGLGVVSIGVASFPFLKTFYLTRVKGYNNTHGQDS